MNRIRRISTLAAASKAVVLMFVLACTPGLEAAPFAEQISFTQPDGTPIELWGEGNEFYAIFETLDGYSVVFDPAVKAYFYAGLSEDGNQLVSTGTQVGQGNPARLGVAKHLRINSAAVKQQVAQRYRAWDAAMEVSSRWSALKTAARQADPAAPGGTVKRPPSFTTTGTKVGLCLLIDFDDDPATIPQAEIVNFCNADNYTGYGNNGSVKKYFYDDASGLLTYSNVVTIYIRIPNSLHPKSWYNDTSKSCGGQGNLLIRDAIAIMKALPNYNTEILPTFEGLTVDNRNRVVACNVFYAGGNGGVWSMGLWPHSSSLSSVGEQELSPGGKKVYRYQITNIGSSLRLGTFCHENGHMLCGFPDIYDYEYDSAGGAGRFCLMNSGGSGTNPSQVCAYLKRAAGWATTTELTLTSSLTAVVTATPGTNFNHFYRYVKPGVPTEYFLVENRQSTWRDDNLPASGLAIWHIDELGDRDNQSLEPNTTHANYECTLVQADNQWHFQRDINSGDAYDLYHRNNTAAEYTNAFSDLTAPHAHWWDGTGSGVRFSEFSASGPTMTFRVEPAFTDPVITLHPSNLTVQAEDDAFFSVEATGFWPLHYQWQFNGQPIPGATNPVLALVRVDMTNAGAYRVVVSNTHGSVVSAIASLTVTLSLGMAIDTVGLNWQTSSGAPWTPQTNMTHDGVDAAQSGQIGDRQSSALQTTVVGPGALSFWWKVSSETNADYLIFYMGSAPMTNITGEVDWQQVKYELTAGNRMLRWVYLKNATGVGGLDAAWVDQVSFVPYEPPTVTEQPVDQLVLAGGDATFNVSVGGTPPHSYQWRFEGVDLPGATSAVLSLSNVQVAQSGRYSVVVSNDFGSTISSNALLRVTTVAAWGSFAGTNVPSDLTNLMALAGGYAHSLALRRDGTVMAWGDNDYGQTSLPPGLNDVMAVAAGRYHSLALIRDGTVVGWGRNDYSQAVVPAGLSGVIAIAAGLDHSLALRNDGVVIGWGRNDYGQAQPPGTLRDVVAIAGGGYHSLALKSDGTVAAWGTNFFGQATPPEGLTGVVAVAGGGEHSLALRGDGSVIAWGLNNYGQATVPSGRSNVMAVAAGRYHSLALQRDGTVTVWGRNNYGQTNLPARMAKIVAVACGYAQSLVLVGSGAPFFATQPVSAQAYTSGDAVLRAAAVGAWPLGYQWQFNAQDIEGATDPHLVLSGVQLSHAGSYCVVARNLHGSVTSAVAALTVQLTLVDALDAADFTWATTSGASWFGVTNGTHDGVDAARSGLIGHGRQSVLQAVVTGPGTLTYWWKVSSETNADLLAFFVSPMFITNISGEVDWRSETVYVPAGNIALRWVYAKNGNGSSGEDAGWLDEVAYSPGATAPIIMVQPVGQTVSLGTNVTFNIAAAGTPFLSYQWRLNELALTNSARVVGATTPRLTIASVTAADAGAYSVVVSNQAGTVASAPAVLGVGSLRLTAGLPPSDGHFALVIDGEPGALCEIQASTNLVVWETLVVYTNALGPIQFIDFASTNLSHRFYRALLK